MQHSNIFISTLPCTTVVQVMEERGVRLSAGIRDFRLLRNVQACPGAEKSSYSSGTRPYFQGVKLPMHETDQLPTSRFKVKKAWNYTHSHVFTPSWRSA